jgi:lipopolysaccharide transport system ATP-binding protein
LEVGTGMHPEMTGKENVYLNGTILGMTKKEIDAKFEEIMDFAGCAKYADTPVKRYSSGMKVRLGFAVAAFLEPEILIVDEVLAVGDAEFQKKAIGKMQDISAGGGRTVLFVSHNMRSIKSITNRCILIEQGEVKNSGDTERIVSHYLKSEEPINLQNPNKLNIDLNSSNYSLMVNQVAVLSTNDKLANSFEISEEIKLLIEFKLNALIEGLYGYLTIRNNDGIIYIETDSFDNPINEFSDDVKIGINKVELVIPKFTLPVGSYLVYLNFSSSISGSEGICPAGYIQSFSIEDNTSRRGNNRKAVLAKTLDWKLC